MCLLSWDYGERKSSPPRLRVACNESPLTRMAGLDACAAVGLCKETAANSGIFEREWTKAKITMDCNSWTPNITLK